MPQVDLRSLFRRRKSTKLQRAGCGPQQGKGGGGGLKFAPSQSGVLDDGRHDCAQLLAPAGAQAAELAEGSSIQVPELWQLRDQHSRRPGNCSTWRWMPGWRTSQGCSSKRSPASPPCGWYEPQDASSTAAATTALPVSPSGLLHGFSGFQNNPSVQRLCPPRRVCTRRASLHRSARLFAHVGRNDTFFSSPFPLTATLNELASVVQRAGQLLRMKQGMDGALDTVDDIMRSKRLLTPRCRPQMQGPNSSHCGLEFDPGCPNLWGQDHSLGLNIPPYNSEWPGFLRARHCIQKGTRSTSKPPRSGIF